MCAKFSFELSGYCKAWHCWQSQGSVASAGSVLSGVDCTGRMASLSVGCRRHLELSGLARMASVPDEMDAAEAAPGSLSADTTLSM